VDEAGARALAAGARRLFVKVAAGIVRLDRALTEDEVQRYLVHGDGLLRVPVLVRGELLVRGYTEELYRAALDAPDAIAAKDEMIG
jgi:arsenate reductase-like glutaredoxin family protein